MSHVDEIKELDALISLMDEPNEDMFSEIREKVLSYGSLALPILEEAWVNTLGDHDSIRIEDIIEEIKQEELILEFSNWAKDSSNNIIQGFAILTKYLQSDFDTSQYIAKFEKLSRETWLEINDSLTALEKIKVINHVFYTVYQFSSEVGLDVKPETYYLNKVLDYKRGNPISVGIIYIAIAQSLNIPVFGVNLKDNFILGYMDDTTPMRLPDSYIEEDVLFYLNVGNRGAIFTSNEIDNYINKIEINPKPDFYLPFSNLDVIKRMVSELIVSLEKENNNSKIAGLKRLL